MNPDALSVSFPPEGVPFPAVRLPLVMISKARLAVAAARAAGVVASDKVAALVSRSWFRSFAASR